MKLARLTLFFFPISGLALAQSDHARLVDMQNQGFCHRFRHIRSAAGCQPGAGGRDSLQLASVQETVTVPPGTLAQWTVPALSGTQRNQTSGDGRGTTMLIIACTMLKTGRSYHEFGTE